MKTDEKYRLLITAATKLEAYFQTSDSGLSELVSVFCGRKHDHITQLITKALNTKIDEAAKEHLNELSLAYMEFISACKKEFAEEDVGKIVALASPFIAVFELFVDRKGDWK